jgi:peptide/nickel transport system substrate-binding protein
MKEEPTMERPRTQFRHVYVLGFVAFILSMLSFATAKAAEQPQYGGVLKIIDVAEGAQPLGTPWEVMGVDSDLIKPVIETLLREDARGGYHPWLATSWKVDMAKNTITLPLRKGVRFHDGTDFNARAAKWNLDQMIKAKTVKGFVSVDIVDDYTVRINVEKYQNNFLNYLCASYGGAVISPTYYEKNGADYVKWHPVGTGPFKFVKFDRGAKLTYARWDGYWQKGRPYLDGIEYLFIRDPMTQQAAMRASGPDKVHVLYVNSGEQAAMMKNQGFKIMSGFVGATSLIPDSANADSPLSNKKVREAVSLAIDRDAIAKARGFGFWAPTMQVPSPQNPGFVASLGTGQFDPKKAKQLLADAGFPNGFKIKLIVQPALVDRDAVVAVQRYLGEVGIQCETEFPDGGGYTAYRFKNGWHNAFMVQAVRMLATTNLYNNFMWNSPGMWPSLKRPEGFQDKITKSLETLMPDKAKMEELIRIQAEDWMIIPLYRQAEIYIMQPNVQDTGFLDWSAATVCTAETMRMSK